jgi:hypothetical protein
MMRSHMLLGLALLAACTSAGDDTARAPDSTLATEEAEHAAARTLLAEAEDLRDSAQVVLATLLTDPASARFDSLVVIQPPVEGGRQPSLAACGRIGGSPGIAGRGGMTRFVYQNRWTVFVEEDGNREQFAALWARSCDPATGTVLISE